MNEALYFLNVLALIFTVSLMYLLYRDQGGSWRIYLEIFLFVLWFAVADLTYSVYPDYGYAPALIYGALSLLSGVFAYFDTIRIMMEDENWI